MACFYKLTINGLEHGKGSESDPFIMGPITSDSEYTIKLLYSDLSVLANNNELQTLVSQLEELEQLFPTLEKFPPLKSINSNIAWKTLAEHMGKLGVQVEVVSPDDPRVAKIPNFRNASAVTQDGVIYINKMKNCTTAPIHELLHLVFGVMKSSDYKAYQNLMDLTRRSKAVETVYKSLSNDGAYKNMILIDLMEEAFCRAMEMLVDPEINTEDLSLDDFPYDDVNKLILPYISQTFGIEKVPSLLSFLNSTVSNLPVKGSTLFMRSTIESTGYSDNIKAITLTGKVTNLISDWVGKGIIKEDCQ